MLSKTENHFISNYIINYNVLFLGDKIKRGMSDEEAREKEN